MLVGLWTTCAAIVLIYEILLPGTLVQSHKRNASTAVPSVRVHAMMLTSPLCWGNAKTLPGKWRFLTNTTLDKSAALTMTCKSE